MGRLFSSLNSLFPRSRKTRRAPRRDRSLFVEDLEGRRLLSNVIQSFVTLPRATSNMISGPDGDLWVGVDPTYSTAAIDRIDLNGSVTSFPVPGTGNPPDGGFTINSLATGPDGNVWFVADFAPTFTDNQVVIGNITPAGLVTEFPPIPVPAGREALNTGAIVSGPDGDLWFGYVVNDPKLQAQDFIGQVTTAGAVTLFPISSFGSKSPPFVDSLAAGADGNLWFTAGLGKSFVFGRMSPSGAVTQFPMRDLFTGSVDNGLSASLVVSALGNNLSQNEVLQVSTAGAIARNKIPAAISDSFRTYLGPADGSLWFSDGISTSFKIGRITASGVATSYNLSKFVPLRQHFVDSMALGQDGDLYVLDTVLGKNDKFTATVYRLSPSELAPVR